MKIIESQSRRLLSKIRTCIFKHSLPGILGHKSPVAYPNFIINGIKFVKNLKQINDFSLIYLNGEWICNVQGLKFVLNSAEDLFILNEVFINGIYNVDIKSPFIFIDVGMNVGITSLFFANKSGCKKVVAFEPFKRTLSLAMKNLTINNVACKIQVNKMGLGYPTRTITVNYSEEYKGSVGINGIAPYISKIKDVRQEQLSIIDAFEVLNDYANEKMILKIDCEGSEYEIVERLHDTGLLSHFDVIMMEWHLKGPALLREILLDNNFEILSMGEHNINTGILYAFRKS